MHTLSSKVAAQIDIVISHHVRAKAIGFPVAEVITIPMLSLYSLDALEESLSHSEFTNCVYMISARGFHFSIDSIRSVFKQNKAGHNDDFYHISKINDSEKWSRVQANTCHYVGSKEKDLLGRLKQHLGLLPKEKRSVYSLYLADWWNDHAEITIEILNFGTEVDSSVLQIIEDSIWEVEQPLFGKKGATFNKKTVEVSRTRNDLS